LFQGLFFVSGSQRCEMLKQVQHDSDGVQHDREGVQHDREGGLE
jgi:hypothetical protein